jgi:hypothetical protein
MQIALKRAAWLAAFAVCAMLAASAADSGAAGKTVIYASKGGGSRPAMLLYAGADWRLPGVGYQATGLRWRDWGRSTARATGRLETCPNMAPCSRYRVKVVASRLARRAEGTTTNVYARLSFTRIGRTRALLKLCTYAEACRLGPVR